MDRLAAFRENIKAGDLVTVSSSQKFCPLRRNNGEWFIPSEPTTRQVKKGEAMIVIVDKTVGVRDEGQLSDESDILTAHEVIVFASGSGCFFGLPRASLCRY